MSAEFLALFTALAYATANVSARWGLRYSTANTATLVSLFLHATLLFAAVFFVGGGVPDVPRLALYLVVLTGILQMLLHPRKSLIQLSLSAICKRFSWKETLMSTSIF